MIYNEPSEPDSNRPRDPFARPAAADETPTRDSVIAAMLADLGITQRPALTAPPRAEFAPPRVMEPPTPFIQRYTYETEVARTRGMFNQGWASWAYLGHILPTRKWWTKGMANLYMEMISGLFPVDSPSLFDEWYALEHQYADDNLKPLRQIEFADRRATELGLTVRKRQPSFKPLPRDKMALRVDPARALLDADRIGVLQLAQLFAERVRRQKDTFAIVDVWSFAPEQFGGGKSQLMLQILSETALALRRLVPPSESVPPFDFRWDVVYADDHARLRRFLGDRTAYACRGIDEMDQFAYKRSSQVGEQKATIAVWKRNRKWGQLWIGCSPSLWELDEFLRDIKVTHRIRVRRWDDDARAGSVEVFVKGGDRDEKSDLWGHSIMEFEYLSLPSRAYMAYKECVLMAEDRTKDAKKSGLDDYLSKNRDWLADVVNEIHEDETPPLPMAKPEVSPEIIIDDPLDEVPQ